MTRSTAIATAAAIHVGQMLASAIVIVAAIETVSWFQMWMQEKRGGE